jgi:2-polyprenyl-3-methyl-5-hydroxy-6-metoxy-1,4-benzoquinol methylase
MTIDKKFFWENKIIEWEDIRYKNISQNQNFFEKFVNITNKTLTSRLNTTLKILKPLVKNKKVVELGCGSGFLAKEIIQSGAKSYTGYDISENAISRAIDLSKKYNYHDKTNFYPKSILQISLLEADYVFSLGLTDWLDDDELKHLFEISKNSENLHSISEDKKSFSQLLHKTYVFLSYSRKTNGYAPRYLKSKKISKLLKINTKKEIFEYRDKNMSFGLLLSTFPINGNSILNKK